MESRIEDPILKDTINKVKELVLKYTCPQEKWDGFTADWFAQKVVGVVLNDFEQVLMRRRD